MSAAVLPLQETTSTTMAKSFRELVGFPLSTASTEDSVLIIIDAQNESVPFPLFSAVTTDRGNNRYADGHLKTANITSTRAEIATLLKKYRAASAPLVHVVHDTPAGAPVFTPSTPLAAIFEELTPLPHETVIHKGQAGSFTDTNLDEVLKKTGRKKVVLTGYMAHVCVSTTARQAEEKGYDVIIAEGAVGDRDVPGASASELVRVTLKELGDAFGTVVKASDIN